MNYQSIGDQQIGNQREIRLAFVRVGV